MQRMPLSYPGKQAPHSSNKKRSQRWIIVGACLLLLLSLAVLYTIVTGRTRKETNDPFTPTASAPATSTMSQVARRLDGVPTERGMESRRPISVMIDNQIDALPWSGLDRASIVIESPVEGGITRLMAFFDPGIPTSTIIGPVRSARPYFIDWARAWEAAYVHVGGSPEALDRLKSLGPTFPNIDEMANGPTFFRDRTKIAPHNVYSSIDALSQTMDRRYGTSTATFSPWRFEPLATSTDGTAPASSVRIPYGGSYSVTWKFDPTLGQYRRSRGTTVQKTREGAELLASNVIVLKTDAQVLDAKGRLSLRTIGSGDAVLYRGGKKYVARWTRAQGELIRLEGADGSEYLLTAGPTWIEITTDDRVFAGLIPSTSTTTTTTATTTSSTTP